MTTTTPTDSNEETVIVKKVSDRVKETAQQSRTALIGRVAELKALINQAIDAKLELALCQIHAETEETITQFENRGALAPTDSHGLKIVLANIESDYMGRMSLDLSNLTVELTEVHLAVLNSTQNRGFTQHSQNRQTPMFGFLHQPTMTPPPQYPGFQPGQPPVYWCRGRYNNGQ